MNSLIRKIFQTIRRRGLWQTLAIIRGQFADIFFDLRHGTDTVRWRPLPTLNIPSPNKDRGNIYQATTTPALRRIFADMRPMLPQNAGLLDVGSGKGKVLLVAADFGFDPIRGIEFSAELCAIARRNATRYFRTRPAGPVPDIIETDAAVYRIQPDEHLFFFFNPFDRSIFDIFMTHLGESLASHPRVAVIVYNHPEHREAIEGVAGFRQFREYTIDGNQYAIFRSDGIDRPGNPAAAG